MQVDLYKTVVDWLVIVVSYGVVAFSALPLLVG